MLNETVWEWKKESTVEGRMMRLWESFRKTGQRMSRRNTGKPIMLKCETEKAEE